MPSNPFTDPQWASRTVDAIDRIVGLVRDRTTRPAVAIVRALIFGSMAVVGAVFLVIILVIGCIRGLHSFFDIWWSRDTAVWASYLFIGVFFCTIGMLLMRRRHPQE
ncbi:MAG: hypothetical protein D4R95_04245 [Actinobacteria bacterium]|nr:MAG: hypothetical protein D4R95_04245 [Actinomycetota bacterium]